MRFDLRYEEALLVLGADGRNVVMVGAEGRARFWPPPTTWRFRSPRVQPAKCAASALEACRNMGYAGEPLSCDVMLSSGHEEIVGLRGPSYRVIERGGGVWMIMGGDVVRLQGNLGRAGSTMPLKAAVRQLGFGRRAGTAE